MFLYRKGQQKVIWGFPKALIWTCSKQGSRFPSEKTSVQKCVFCILPYACGYKSTQARQVLPNLGKMGGYGGERVEMDGVGPHDLDLQNEKSEPRGNRGRGCLPPGLLGPPVLRSVILFLSMTITFSLFSILHWWCHEN